MIIVKVIEKNDRIQAFEMSGHADFAEHGKDLVCAGASAVSFGAVNAMMKLTDQQLVIEQGTDGGYLRVEIPANTSQENELQLIVRTMIISLETIELDYGQHIQLQFVK